jgi:hypothetical protein
MGTETNVIAEKETNRYFPYASIYHYTRNSFFTCGQDSWVQPPAQDDDKFMELTNVEPVIQGILQRRRGYTLWSNPSAYESNIFPRLYKFQSDTTLQRNIVACSASSVIVLDELGNFDGEIFAPSSGAYTPRMVYSRSYGYFVDGLLSDNKKWSGGLPPIATNITTSGAAGILGPGTYQFALTYSDGRINGYINRGHESLPSQIYTVTLTAGITQIIFNVAPGGVGATYVNVYCTQVNGSTFYFYNQTPAGLTGIAGPINPSYGPLPTVDSLFLTNWGIAAPTTAITVGVPTAGAITLNSGRNYVACFRNSLTGHISSINPFSASTGPLSNENVPLSNIPVSTDFQVDRVEILATADGGNETTLYFLADIANGTTTLTDNIPELTLLASAVYQDTDSTGALHGVIDNTPPPLGTFPLKNQGYLWMANDQVLLFSKSLTDVTTSTGTIVGRYEECWPIYNQMDISETAETVQALYTDGQTLYMGTERHIRRLIGSSPATFQAPEVIFSEVGVVNNDVCKSIFLEGQPTGAMWLTTDFRVIQSDFNTYQDVGTPIQNILNTINSAATKNITGMYANQGAYDLFMLFVPTNGSTYANIVCVYNLRLQLWTVWEPSDLIGGTLFNVNVSGVPQWLFATANGSGNVFYIWDSTQGQDRNLNTPVGYPVTMQSSWVDFGDGTLKKACNIATIFSDDPNMTVEVDGALLGADFVTPKQVVPATALSNDPLGNLILPMGDYPGQFHWYRFTFTSPATVASAPNTVRNLVASLDIEAAPLLRV